MPPLRLDALCVQRAPRREIHDHSGTREHRGAKLNMPSVDARARERGTGEDPWRDDRQDE